MPNFTDLNCNTLTFRQLELLTDTWLAELNNWKDTFNEQSISLSKYDVEVSDADIKLKAIYCKLRLLQFVQTLIDSDVEHIRIFQDNLEMHINEVQRLLRDSDCIDCYREQTYGTAEKINVKLRHIKVLMGDIDDLYDRLNNNESLSNSIVEDMVKHLQQLETAEIDIQIIKSKLNELNYYKRLTLSKLGIRENKLV